MSLNLFVYGTLMFPQIMARVTGILTPGVDARLPGYARYTLADREPARVPVIVAESGSCVHGKLFSGLDQDIVTALDRFEEVDTGRYRRITVVVEPAGGEWLVADAYVAGERVLPHLAGPWQPEHFERHELERYVAGLVGGRAG